MCNKSNNKSVRDILILTVKPYCVWPPGIRAKHGLGFAIFPGERENDMRIELSLNHFMLIVVWYI